MTSIRPRRTGTRWPLEVPPTGRVAVPQPAQADAVRPALDGVILVDLRDWGEFRRGRELLRMDKPDSQGRVCFLEIIK